MSFYYSFQSPFFDGYFGLEVVTLVALAVLTGFAFATCQGWNVPGSRKQTFFGFRVALILATLSTLVEVISLAVIAAQTYPGLYFSIFGLFGTAAYYVARAFASFALIRVAFAPQVAAGVFRRDKALAWGAATLSMLTGVAIIIINIYFIATEIAQTHGALHISSLLSVANRAAAVLGLIDRIIFVIIGAVGLGAAIHSLRKSRQLEIHPEVRRAAKMMIGAASVWTAAGVVYAVFTGLIEVPALITHGRLLASAGLGGSIAFAGLDLIWQVVLYALLVATFRKAKDILPL